MVKWQSLIEAEKLVLFMVDECHLLWGDLVSYAWGRKDKRIDIPIKNERERQTYKLNCFNLRSDYFLLIKSDYRFLLLGEID